MLFLKMQPGVAFSPTVVAAIKSAIARECSKRHVPKYVFETPEIPVSFFLPQSCCWPEVCSLSHT